MRILFLINNLKAGGAERVCAHLSGAWAQAGHAVVVMPTYTGDDFRNDFAFAPGIAVRPLLHDPGYRTRRSQAWLSKLRAIRAEIRDGGYDIVVSFLTNENIRAAVAASGTGVPLVLSERCHPPTTPLGAPLRMLRRLTYPAAACLVMQTRAGAEWARRSRICSSVEVIANPLVLPLPGEGLETPPDRIVPAGRKLLLAAGRLHRQKRFDTLIEAFAIAHRAHPEWDLVILGEGEECRALQQRIDGLRLAGHVTLQGRTSAMDAWYRRADAFTMTSAYEGYPNALLEALGYGLPVLATDCETGPRELVRDGANGILVDNHALPGAIAEGLGRLFALSADYKDLLGDRMRHAHSLPIIARRWLDLFSQLVREDRR